jgi:uncharacterized protein
LFCAVGLARRRNYDKSSKWIRKAAEQGIAVAQTLLGAMYVVGESVSKNDVEAVKRYLKAAEGGLGPAALP